MVQNHMLQLLALIAMEPPSLYDGTAIRDEKVKVLRSLRTMKPEEVPHLTVTGQYNAGAVNGKIVCGYADELGRAYGAETFVAVKAQTYNSPCQGVDSDRKSTQLH